MSRASMARPKGLASMDLTPDQVRLLDDQVRPVVNYAIDTHSLFKPLSDSFRELARNCYLQGVLDGQQVHPKEPT